jgi:hypothetical protein
VCLRGFNLEPSGETSLLEAVIICSFRSKISIKFRPKWTLGGHRHWPTKTKRWVVQWLVTWFRRKRETRLLSDGSFDSVCFRIDCYLFHAHTLEMVESCKSLSSVGNERNECCHILEDTALLSNGYESLKFSESQSCLPWFLIAEFLSFRTHELLLIWQQQFLLVRYLRTLYVCAPYCPSKCGNLSTLLFSSRNRARWQVHCW